MAVCGLRPAPVGRLDVAFGGWAGDFLPVPPACCGGWDFRTCLSWEVQTSLSSAGSVPQLSWEQTWVCRRRDCCPVLCWLHGYREALYPCCVIVQFWLVRWEPCLGQEDRLLIFRIICTGFKMKLSCAGFLLSMKSSWVRGNSQDQGGVDCHLRTGFLVTVPHRN